jgi:DNA-3-methyladenine glycosylase
MTHEPIKKSFFNRDAVCVAKNLLGKIIYSKYKDLWLTAQIIETEAYYLNDKASHASLGFTNKRKALLMSPGTIYMYFSRGADSLNISCRGHGNAVLIKSGFPVKNSGEFDPMITIMQKLNPLKNKPGFRDIKNLCSGQTLLCKSLNLKVKDWDRKQFNFNRFFISDQNYSPKKIVTTRRLGISKGRDEHLPYRFIDHHFIDSCTKNPITKRTEEGLDYVINSNQWD